MLEQLSPELLLLIQQSLDSLVDLHALIAASPSNLRTFESYRQHVLPAVLKNAICPVALPSALAIINLHTLDLRRRLSPGLDTELPRPLQTFLDDYLFGAVSPFPEDEAGFTRLRGLYVRAMRFAEDYATRALRVLSAGDADADKVTARDRAVLHLSPGERGRLLRAFFRFELYCRIFQPPEGTSAAAQRDIFLLKLRPFEVEELACVHHYFSTVVGGFLDQLEDQFVEEVLTAAKAHVDPAVFNSLGPNSRRRSASPSLGFGTTVASEEPRHRSTVSGCRDEESALYQERRSSPLSPNSENNPYDINNGTPWAPLNDLELYDLDLFSSINKERYPRYISFIVSLGIDFIHALVNADGDRRRRMILDNSPGLRPFLPEAIRSIPFPDPDSDSGSLQQDDLGDQNRNGDTNYGGGNDDDPRDPNYSWVHLGRPSTIDDYIRSEVDQAPLRARAWVFWDKKRVVGDRGAVYQGLSAAKRMDDQRLLALYDRTWRQSGEERLSGVLLLMGERMTILQKYASTMEMDDDDDDEDSEDSEESEESEDSEEDEH